VVAPDSPRAIPPEELARAWHRSMTPVEAAPDLALALERALTRAGRRGSVLVCGSHYLVGPALRLLGCPP
jgi:folylpolyglutamate synthase/dihydropteroate synthase